MRITIQAKIVSVFFALLALTACGGGSTAAPSALITPTAGNSPASTLVSGIHTWTLLSGSEASGATPDYGTEGVAAPSNNPGDRYGSASWVDGNGDLWVFSGSSASGTYPGDMWMYSPSTNEWTWESGTQATDNAGVYGTKGSPAATNLPGGRTSSATWVDSQGRFWMFGGYGYSAQGAISALNDLWMYAPATNEWTWEGGSDAVNTAGTYGTLGVPAAGNVPGARAGASAVIDSSGNVWLFGGAGYDSTDTNGFLNDLWKYTSATGQWTWESGSDLASQSGIYGTQGVSTSGNVPGGRSGGDLWLDTNGNLWVFGGNGYSASSSTGFLNDLWEFNPVTTQWTWMSGAETAGAAGNYGTEYTPSASNIPGARVAASAFVRNGVLWMFGGSVFSSGTEEMLGDLWQWNPATSEWTWAGGLDSPNAPDGSVPGGRDDATLWSSGGYVYLYGGFGRDQSGTLGGMNDVWRGS